MGIPVDHVDVEYSGDWQEQVFDDPFQGIF